MFENILIPVSSEFYSKKILERSVFLAEKFDSKLTIIYIIEEKTLDQADMLSDTYRTHYDMNETKKQIVKEQIKSADSIVFNDAKFFFKDKKISFEEKIKRGEFSSIIKNELEEKKYDLILMGFEKECVLNYRLFDEVDIPIWVDGKNQNPTILAVCSNLAPNIKVPDFSKNLSQILGWNLHMIYVIDAEDSVHVDQKGQRSDKKSEQDLFLNAQDFVDEMQKKDLAVKIEKGVFEKVVHKTANEVDAGLIIIGRQKKKKGMLGFPVRHIKQKLVEKCEHPIILLN